MAATVPQSDALTGNNDRTRDAGWPAGVARRLFVPIDIGLLVYFRMAFGAIMLWEVFRYVLGARLERLYERPEFFFSYYGFEWVSPWPGDGVYYHFAVLGLAAVCIILGLFYRVAATVFFLGFTHFFLWDQTNYLNHFYLISLISFLMIFLPVHRSVSLDVVRRPELRATKVPAWTLWTLRLQIAVPYFFGGIAKLNSDWLHGEPMRMWLSGRFGTEVSEPVVYFFTFGGLLFDLLIVPFLLWRKTLVPAFIGAVAFHFMNDNLFVIGVFPWFMVFGTLLFCPPEWVPIGEGSSVECPESRARQRRRAADNPPPLSKGGPGGVAHRSHDSSESKVADGVEATPPHPPLRRGGGSQRLVLAALGLWFAVQVLLPFRHWLYPGNVSWTEEGHKFSWHMKLRDKDAARCRFGVLTRDDGEFVWELTGRIDDQTGLLNRYLHFTSFDASGRLADRQDPAAGVLTSRQIGDMSTEPDMILEFAHFLAERVRQAGHEPLEARVDVAVSLNGRETQRMIDESANLLAVRRSLKHAGWIVPLTTPLERPSFWDLFREGPP